MFFNFPCHAIWFILIHKWYTFGTQCFFIFFMFHSCFHLWMRWTGCLLQNRPHHLVAQFGCFGESRRKVFLDPLEAVPVGLEVAKWHAVGPGLYRSQLMPVGVASDGLTRAAKVNSKSSDRNVLSSIAVSRASSRSSGLRNRYSVTPSHRRNS